MKINFFGKCLRLDDFFIVSEWNDYFLTQDLPHIYFIFVLYYYKTISRHPSRCIQVLFWTFK